MDERKTFLALIFVIAINGNLIALNLPAATLQNHVIAKRSAEQDDIEYETRYFSQKVDHFAFGSNATFQQRYLIATQYWNGNGGPIFLYTGNEGSIDWFCNNTGFMWDIAPKFKAMLVFAEHRYYGESLPFGQETYKDPANLKYLTVEQTLIDFAVLVRHLKRVIVGARNSPVVAFGGSYGGMLATWFRMKYPNIVIGALASSAPIWSFLENADCHAFYRSLTHTFNITSTQCVSNIRRLWATIDRVANASDGLSYLTDTFHLCKPLQNRTNVLELRSWIRESIEYLGMIDYPYPANFIQPLSAWPVKEFCKPFDRPSLTDRQLVEAASASMNYYLNNTGNKDCMNIGSDATEDLGLSGWSYQACTELLAPSCTDGVQDMFVPSPWNFMETSDFCYQEYGVRPDLAWLDIEYWGKRLKSASNIIFSNGLLDPWNSGGVLESQSPSVVAITIPRGAHHLDLRRAHPLDTEDVKAARQKEIQIIQSWIDNAGNFKTAAQESKTISSHIVINASSLYISVMSLITLVISFSLS